MHFGDVGDRPADVAEGPDGRRGRAQARRLARPCPRTRRRGSGSPPRTAAVRSSSPGRLAQRRRAPARPRRSRSRGFVSSGMLLDLGKTGTWGKSPGGQSARRLAPGQRSGPPPVPIGQRAATMEGWTDPTCSSRPTWASTARRATSSSTPGGPVPRAVVTHAHADHACWGCGRYLTSAEGAGVLRVRMGREAVDRRPGFRPDGRDQRRDRSRSTRPGTSWARRRSGWNIAAKSGSSRATTRSSPTPPAPRSSRSGATPSSPNRPSACRSTDGRRSGRSSTRSTPGGDRTRNPAGRACCWPTPSASPNACSRASTRRSARSTRMARSRS